MDLSLDHPGINLPSGQDVADIHHQPGMGGDEAVVDAGMVGGNEHCIVGGQILRGQRRGFHFEVMPPGRRITGMTFQLKNPSVGNMAGGWRQ